MRLVVLLTLLLPLALADCPPGAVYESSFNKCYQVVHQPLTFPAAEDNCRELGGHLVAISNSFENSFVAQLAANQSTVGRYWIGANWLWAPDWSWTSNDSFSYTNWAANQPIDPSIYMCGGAWYGDNYWYKLMCNLPGPSVCSIDPNDSPPCPICPICSTCPPAPTTTACPGNCLANYEMSPADCKCYRWFQSAYLTFNDSVTFCNFQNATLSIITSAAQNEWLADWLVSLGLSSSFPWIGLSCPGNTKDSCFWINGSPLTGYANFNNVGWEGGRLANYTGSNRNFFIRLDSSANDYGMWMRYYDDVMMDVVCMKDPFYN